MLKLLFLFTLNLFIAGSSFANPERLNCSLMAGGERKGSVALHLDEFGAVTSANLKVNSSGRGFIQASFDSDGRRSNSYGRISTRGSETKSTHEVSFSSNLSSSNRVIGFRLRAPVWSTREEEPGFFEQFLGTAERRELGQLDFFTGGRSYRYGITCMPVARKARNVAVNESDRRPNKEIRGSSGGSSRRSSASGQ